MNLSSRQDTSFTSPSFSCLSAGRYLTTKEQFHEFLEAKGQEKPSQESEAVDPAGNDLIEPEAKRIRLEDRQTEDGQAEEAAETGEQLQAQKRARGQNKCRPHVKPTHYDKNKLCPSLVQVCVTVAESPRCLECEPVCPPAPSSIFMTLWCIVTVPIFQVKKLRLGEVSDLSEDTQPGGEGSGFQT